MISSRQPMSREHQEAQPRQQAARAREVLFIDQNPASFQRGNIRAIASHARRWQTNRKHQERRFIAQQEAGYARSLVGWQTTTPPGTSSLDSQSEWAFDVVTPQGYRERQQKGMQSETMPFQIHGGLREDPFDSLPSPGSRDVAEMVDYCE